MTVQGFNGHASNLGTPVVQKC